MTEVAGLPPSNRYGPEVDSARGEAGTFDTTPCTLEAEALAGGWNALNSPWPPPDYAIQRAGMRGEPSIDDDD